MTAVNFEVIKELEELIEDLTTTGKQSLDEKQLKRVKNICKRSNAYVNHAYHILMTQLKKKHSEIRLSCFQIISELFSRSHVFRELILGEFQIFLELVVGTDSNVPLPPPLKAAGTLKEKAVEAVENWYQKYGNYYKKLDLGYHYLKRIKHVEFDAIRTRTLAERRQAEDIEQRRQLNLKKKVDKAENEIAEQAGHIELCLTEIKNCFKLLLPHPDDYEVHCLEIEKPDSSFQQNDDRRIYTPSKETQKEMTTTNSSNQNTTIVPTGNTSHINDMYSIKQNYINKVRSEERQATDLVKDHGLGSRSYKLSLEVNTFCKPSVDETDDNTIIINTVKEMNKEITHKYLPMVNQWLQVFTKAGHSNQRILSIIDLKRRLQSAKDKFNELNISPKKYENNKKPADDDDSDDDEDEFIDVPEKEGIEYIPESKMAEYGLESTLKNQNSLCHRQTDILSEEGTKIGILKQFGFTLKDAEDPTSHARAILEARKRQRAPSSKNDQCHSFMHTFQSSSPSEESQKRKQMLEKAPVVPFDMDLYHWEDPNYDPPKIIKSDNFNNYWAAATEPEFIFKEDKGSMLKRTILFGGKFQPVKWSCRVLLPNGNLCPRKDRIKCPFHGVIVARDNNGNPVGERNSDKGTSIPAYSTSTSASTTSTSASTTSTSASTTSTSAFTTSTSAFTTSTSASNTSTSVDQITEDWREIQPDIEAATGLDLGMKAKKQKGWKKKSGTSKKKMSRKQKYSRLTDIHKPTKTPRSRLERKVLSRESLKRVAEEMDNLATKRFLDKFGDQFNYQIMK